MIRNCHRCGLDFSAEGWELICPTCRNMPRTPKDLAPREQEIVDLVIQAKSNKEIAHKLGLSEGTVKEYLSIIYRKIQIHSRTQLAIWALTHKKGDTDA